MTHPQPVPQPGADSALPADSAEPAVRVRLFAALREAAGWSERCLSLPSPSGASPCTPLSLWQRLAIPVTWTGSASSTAALPAGVRVAINQRFVPPDTPLQPGDELAFLPPITGG